MGMKTRAILDFLVGLAPLYEARHQKPLWSNKYPRHLIDSVEAACMFLEGYAFERQGKNPSYAPAAVDAVKTVRKRSNSPSPRAVQREFEKLLKGTGMNRNVNPLMHSTRNCKCFWCAFKGNNIVALVKSALQENEVEWAWKKVHKVRGVGPKITALFLRDVAMYYNLAPEVDRHLLQPVDVWVRRTVHLIAQTDQLTDEQVALWLVDKCREPERANAAIWYWGAQVMRSDFLLRRSVRNLSNSRRRLKTHLANLKAASEALG